jgi:hypothetical protein
MVGCLKIHNIVETCTLVCPVLLENAQLYVLKVESIMNILF